MIKDFWQVSEKLEILTMNEDPEHFFESTSHRFTYFFYGKKFWNLSWVKDLFQLIQSLGRNVGVRLFQDFTKVRLSYLLAVMIDDFLQKKYTLFFKNIIHLLHCNAKLIISYSYSLAQSYGWSFWLLQWPIDNKFG